MKENKWYVVSSAEMFNRLSEKRFAIMGVAMMLIMLSHQYFIRGFPWNIFQRYGHWGVDVFIFLSGMGLVRSLQRNKLTVYYHRRMARLFTPCIFCGVFKYSSFLIIGEPIENIKDTLNLGWWSLFSLDLWFIYTIIILYIIAPGLYKCLSGRFFFTTIVLACVAYSVTEIMWSAKVGNNWMSPIGIFVWTVGRLPVFVLGMTLAIRPRLICSIFLLFSFLSLQVAILFFKPFTCSLYFSFLHQLFVTIGVPSLVILIIIYLESPINVKLNSKFLYFIGERSLEIYLLHEFIFWSLYVSLGNILNHYVLFIIAFVIIIAIANWSNMIIKIIRRK